MKFRSKKAFLFLWAIIALSLLFSLLSSSAQASTVGTSTVSNATHYQMQRRSFFANTRYWVFYSEGTNLYYKNSTTGADSSWENATAVTTCNRGYKFSVFFDGTYFHYALSDDDSYNNPIYYRRGLPNSDGTVTWDAQRTALAAGGGTVKYGSPNIMVDTNGYAWIGYARYDSGTGYNYVWVTKNNNTDGTWAAASGFPYNLNNSWSQGGMFVVPVPLTSGYALCIYASNGIAMRSRRWNGSWGSEIQPGYSQNGALSAVNEGDDVHVCYNYGAQIVCTRYIYSSDSYDSQTTVQTITSTTPAPVVSLDTSNNDLYCFWGNTTTSYIQFKKKTQAGTWDSSATNWISESSLTGSDGRFSSFYSAYGGHIGLVYSSGASNPYSIKFGVMNPTAVGLETFRVIRKDEGVLLEWQTGYEVNTLGFNIFREENGQRIRANPEIIAGSALLSGSGRVTGSHSYSWLDQSAISYQPSALKYWLEDLDINGKRTWHGPVTPVFSDKPLPKRTQAALLSHLARNQAEQQPGFSKAQTLNARLRKISFEKSPPLYSKEFKSIEKLSPQEVQWALAGHPAVKLYIQEEGWYRVTQPDLIAAGLDPNINPRFLQLFVDGEEQSIVVTGKKDGKFGPKDAIEFYAKGLDTPFTDTRVYWLVAGSKPGKRVQQLFRGLGGRITSTSFPYVVEKKPRMIYFAALKNGEAENFFGPVISQAPVDQVLEVRHPDPFASGDAVLEVVLQGVTFGSHEVKVLLNGAEVGLVKFKDRAQGLARVRVSQGVLRSGENVVTLVRQGGEGDVSLVDFIKLTYWHTYTADDDVLRFAATGGKQLLLEGFSSPRIQVMDITDPTKVQKVDGVVKAQAAGYSIRVEVPWPGQRTLLAFTDERVEKPAAMEVNHPSSWHQAKQGADLVIISHGDFLESLKPLKALRETQGWSVALIDIEDLYDEFGFGVKSPAALRDFLKRAKTQWQKPPRFVLLAGDASFDPRNYLGFGNFDFVSTKLVDTFYLETASDDWFVDFNGDGLPEMAVGRLPVRTVEEAKTVVSKIIGYEQFEKNINEIVFVADINDGDFDFESANSQVKALLPDNIKVSEVFRNHFEDDVQVRRTLLDILNQGPLLVNYVGHSTTEWWRGRVFSSDDADDLVNGQRLSFFVNMTCLNGFFHDLYTESLAESLLKAKNGGAVAVWASSGLTEPGGQALMNKELIRLLFNGESLTIGETVMRAKAAAGDGDVRRTWILFGDPTTRLKY